MISSTQSQGRPTPAPRPDNNDSVRSALAELGKRVVALEAALRSLNLSVFGPEPANVAGADEPAALDLRGIVAEINYRVGGMTDHVDSLRAVLGNP